MNEDLARYHRRIPLVSWENESEIDVVAVKGNK